MSHPAECLAARDAWGVDPDRIRSLSISSFVWRQVLGESDSPDEALLKRCAHFDFNGSSSSAKVACDHIVSTRHAQLEQCEQEIIRQIGFARSCIDQFEKVD